MSGKNNKNSVYTAKQKAVRILAVVICIAVIVAVSISLLPMLYGSSGASNNSTPYNHAENANTTNYNHVKSAMRYIDEYVQSNNQSHGTVNGALPEAGGEDSSADSSASGSSSSHSETILQTENVDEEDLIKTDGKFIYTVNGYGGAGNISVVSPGENPIILDSAHLDGWVSGLYINDDVLSVIHSTDVQYSYENGMGYDDTAVTSFSVSDVGMLTKLSEVVVSGGYSSSRMIGSIMYIVTNYSPYDTVYNEPETFIPSCYENGERTLIEPEDIIIPTEPRSKSFVVVSSVDTATGKVVDSKSTMGGYGQVYSSVENIYISYSVWNYENFGMPTDDIMTDSIMTDSMMIGGETTEILKFSLDGGSIEFVAQSTLDGYILNQFSMDEFEGNLRVATTVHSSENGESSNNVVILGSDMQKRSEIVGIAPTEQIYSVRFMGEMGYVVTFRQVDPLFAISLEADSPKILGELKIPGFSNYLHPAGDGLLLGIGRDADMNGRTGELNSRCLI